ncbi:MAG: amidohydrolase family protein [Muribaculaceae bacterium]|nr:amidohydrolase family protein [Muribaculaceae bacterium]
MKVLIHNARIVSGLEPEHTGWLLTSGADIDRMGRGSVPPEVLAEATETVDAAGRLLLPGAIDVHVHFREPGLTHKASIASESRAALAGGVTSWIEMPNTRPATVSRDLLEAKEEIAARTAAGNYAFMIGATADNLRELQLTDYSRVAAVKVFMGSSTGNMLLDGDDPLRAVFAEQPGRVVVHAEDQGVIDRLTARYSPIPDPENMIWHTRLRPAEACVRATEHAMELAERYGTRLHVAHVTTAAECALFDPDGGDPASRRITAEVSPHHLIHCSDDYARLGSRIKMNPSVKSAADRDALRRALADGRLSVIATDHAPHTLAEKQGDVFTAMSGAPMVQFSLPAMLDMFGPEMAVSRMCKAPARLFGIESRGVLAPGYRADMVLVEHLDEPYTVTDADVLSPCGWTPMTGRQLHHRVVRAWVNGGTGPEALRFRI